MFKKLYQKIGLAVLLLSLMLAAMIGFFGPSASAAEETVYTLTVTIPEDAAHGKVYLSIGGGTPVEVVSGQAYTITRGIQFALTSTAEPGYRVQWLNNSTGFDSIQYSGPAGEDMDYTASFVAIPYNIHYVGETAGDYYFPNGVVRTHTYNTETAIINPTRLGYTLGGWYLYTEDPTDKDIEASLLSSNLTLGRQQTTQDIWLKPHWVGIEYAVIRLDCVFEAGKPFNLAECLGYQILPGAMGTEVDGTVGEATVYKGYEFYSAYDYVAGKIPVTISYLFADADEINMDQIIADPSREGYNVVFRYYLPKEYTVTPDLNAGDDTVTYKDGATMPQKHVFNQNTQIPDPVREGYTFEYWTVLVDGVEVKKGYPDFVLTAKEDLYDGEITLKANWKANEYDIHYQWGGASDAVNEAIAAQNALLLTQYKTYTFDTAPVGMPYPIRTGYTFVGWIVTVDGANPYDGPVKDLPAELFSSKPMPITLTAQWVANDYTVTLDGNGATSAGSPSTLSVTFDGVLDTSSLVLPRRFGYTFLGYFTAATGGEKYINADGSFSRVAWDIAVDTTLYAQWEMLPQIAAPAFRVDYVNEELTVPGGIPVGRYEFSFGETVLEVIVTDSSMTVNGHIATSISIPDEFFGQTVLLMVYGDGENTSHNYVNLPINARPKAPELHKEIKDISENYSQIEIVLMETLPAGYSYEFALSLKPNAHKGELQWQTTSKFENLTPGTIYYVYVRVKASADNYAHGVAFCKAYTTYHDLYVEEKVNDLLALKKDSDGDLVNRLIDKAIAEVRAKEPSATFYSDLEGIYNRALIEIEFARRQDTRIAELRALRNALIATECYNQYGENALNSLCEAAIANIAAASTAESVQEIYGTACLAMYEVKITYLRYGGMELTSLAGMKQGLALTMIRLENLGALTSSVDTAVNLGKITVSGFGMTLAEAVRDLRTKDVMAAYSMKITDGDLAITALDGAFTFRLLLPEELLGEGGLLVAYYNQRTGELEVLDTERDGNCLVFSANRIADFVILGDPTLNMTGVVGALGAVLLLQIIAIVLLLMRRSKGAKTYGFAPVAFLSIRVLPDNALLLTVILGTLVVLLQILLMYLLLSSDLLHRPKEKRKQTNRMPEISVMAQADDGASDAIAVSSMAEEDPLRMYDEDGAAPFEPDPIEGEAFDDSYDEIYEEAEDEIFYDEEPDGQMSYAGESEESAYDPFEEDGAEDLIDGAEKMEEVYEQSEEMSDEQSAQEYLEEDFPKGESLDGDELPSEEFFEGASKFEADPDDSIDLTDSDEEPFEDFATGDTAAFEYDEEELATGAPVYDEEVPLEEEELLRAQAYEEPTEDALD